MWLIATVLVLPVRLLTEEKNNAVWASTSDNAQLTVTSLLVDWCNIQYPTSGTITAGDAYNVYAKVYLGGVTNAGSRVPVLRLGLDTVLRIPTRILGPIGCRLLLMPTKAMTMNM